MEMEKKENLLSNLDFTDLELGVGLIRYYLFFFFSHLKKNRGGSSRKKIVWLLIAEHLFEMV